MNWQSSYCSKSNLKSNPNLENDPNTSEVKVPVYRIPILLITLCQHFMLLCLLCIENWKKNFCLPNYISIRSNQNCTENWISYHKSKEYEIYIFARCNFVNTHPSRNLAAEYFEKNKINKNRTFGTEKQRIVLHQFVLFIREYEFVDFVDFVYVVAVARDINTVDILRLEDVMFCVLLLLFLYFFCRLLWCLQAALNIDLFKARFFPCSIFVSIRLKN